MAGREDFGTTVTVAYEDLSDVYSSISKVSGPSHSYASLHKVLVQPPPPLHHGDPCRCRVWRRTMFSKT
jgi:hypothetical protein